MRKGADEDADRRNVKRDNNISYASILLPGTKRRRHCDYIIIIIIIVGGSAQAQAHIHTHTPYDRIQISDAFTKDLYMQRAYLCVEWGMSSNDDIVECRCSAYTHTRIA